MIQATILLFSSFISVSQAGPATCFEGRPDTKRKARNGKTHLVYNIEARRNQNISFNVRSKKPTTINSCAGEKTVAINRLEKGVVLKRHNGALSSAGSEVTLALSRCPKIRVGGVTKIKLIKDKVVKTCNVRIKPAKKRVIFVKNKVGAQRCGEPISLVRAKQAQSTKTNKQVRNECRNRFPKSQKRFKKCYGAGSREIGNARDWLQNHAKCCPRGMAFKGFDRPSSSKPSEKVAVKCVRR